MSKIVVYFIGIIATIAGLITFVFSVVNLKGTGIIIGAIIAFCGIILTVVGKTFLNSTNSSTTNSKESNTVNALVTTNSVNTSSPAPLVEKKEIQWNELNAEEVITRYLTTEHCTCPSTYKHSDYLHAEFDCMLHNLKHAEVKLNDTKVLRNQAILTPFESSRNITASTKMKKLKDFIAVDVETTGLKTGYNDIIEISAIKFVDFEPKEIFTTLLKPRKPIPPEATAINGITDEMVKDAPTFSQIHDSLKEYLGKSNLVFHNASFDVKFLFVSGLEFHENQVFYCTLELSKRFLKDWDGKPYESYKLTDICSEVYIYFNDAHRSSADALATGLLFNEIVKAKKDVTNLIEATTYEG